MRKLFTDFPICGKFQLPDGDSHHVLTVLRHTAGDVLCVTDSTGTTYECVLAAVEDHSAVLLPRRKISEGGSKNGNVILAAALLKGDKFDWVVQKAAELGASRIVPVQMENCVVKLNETRCENRKVRWQRVALEASKQCGRNDVPTVDPIVDFAGLLDLYGHMRFVIPYERETVPIAETCCQIRMGDVLLCIGPEGGFSKREIILARQKLSWCRTVSLGPRILRAETAALAALSIVMYERGFK